MEFTYYGHACFALHAEGKTLLIDPFISGNEKAKHIDINHIQADYIAISHGHADHIADAEAIALRTGALVICAYEIHDWLQAKGIHRTHPMNTGGSHTFGPFTIKCTVAQHSSCLPDGSYGGNPLGFLIQTSQHNVYYSGDTALTFDMQLIPMWAKLNAAILPIGDNFTMGYSDARIATQWCGAPKTIGVHFDTFPPITINHEEAKAHFNTHQLELILPTIGETFSIH